MKRVLPYLSAGIVAIVLLVVSCTVNPGHNDPEDEQAERLASECTLLQNDVASLREMIIAGQSGRTVTSFATISESGSVEGYRLVFEDGSEMVLHNHSSAVSVAESPGKYFWTLSGDLLTDAEGNGLAVDAVSTVPQFRVAGGRIEYSVDGGTLWNTFERDSCRLIEKVTEDAAGVFFTFAGGATVVIRKQGALNVTLEGDDVTIRAGEAVSVYYSVAGVDPSGSDISLEVLCSDGWDARIIPADNSKGRIAVAAPDPITQQSVILVVSDAAGRSVAVRMRFVIDTSGGGEPEPPATPVLVPLNTVIHVTASGGKVSAGVITNTEYTVSCNAGWIHIGDTKAVRTEYLELTVDENTSRTRSRGATVTLASGNYTTSFVVEQAKARPAGEGPIPVCHIMPCCRAYNSGTSFLVGGKWVASHNYSDITQVRSIFSQIKSAGISVIGVDFTNGSQWDAAGESATHNGDGGEFWYQFKPMIDNIVQVCEEKEMKFFFLIGNTQTCGGLDYWNSRIARRIWENWAQEDVYYHYGYGDDRPMLVCFLPGTNFEAQMRGATAAQREYLDRFHIGTCQINSAITPRTTDGWGYRNYSQSSDGKARFACPNGGVPPQDWYRVDADEWQRRVNWALEAKEYAVLGSYDDTCDAIFWGMADTRLSTRDCHKNASTVDDPYIYYNIVRRTLTGL